MKKGFKKGYLVLAIGCLLVLFGIGYYYLLTPFSCKKTTTYLYIDADDNYDIVTLPKECGQDGMP